MGGLGAVTAAAGVAAWLTNAVVVGLALGIFGTVLIVLSIIQHLLLRRDELHSIEQAVLRKDGVELFLRNGEVRGISWRDSDLALTLISRKAAPPANREYLLVWLSDAKIPAIEVSAEGYETIIHEAEAQRLLVSTRRRGRRETSPQWVEIRQGESPTGGTFRSSASVQSGEE